MKVISQLVCYLQHLKFKVTLYLNTCSPLFPPWLWISKLFTHQSGGKGWKGKEAFLGFHNYKSRSGSSQSSGVARNENEFKILLLTFGKLGVTSKLFYHFFVISRGVEWLQISGWVMHAVFLNMGNLSCLRVSLWVGTFCFSKASSPLNKLLINDLWGQIWKKTRLLQLRTQLIQKNTWTALISKLK